MKPTIVQLILNATAAGKAMLTAANAAAQKSLLSLTKSDVGLSNVDNTADANKPVSSAQQAALDAKQATLVSGTNIKTVNSTSLLGSGNIAISAVGGSTGATDNRVLRSDGTGGATVQNSAVTIDDSGNVSGVGTLAASGQISGPAGTVASPGIRCGGGGLFETSGIQTFSVFGSTGAGFNSDGSVELHSTAGIYWRTTTPWTAGSRASRVIPNTTTQLDVRADDGLRVRNQSNSAGAPLIAGAITASGLLTANGGEKGTALLFAALPAASANTDVEYIVSDRTNRPKVKSDGTNWRNLYDGTILT